MAFFLFIWFTLCKFTPSKALVFMATLFDQDFTQAAPTETATQARQEAPQQAPTPAAAPTSILSKILGAKKTNTQRITEADLIYCTGLDTKYKAILANLQKWVEIFKEELESNWAGQYEIRTNYTGTHYMAKNHHYAPADLESLRFFPGDEYVTILNNIREIKSTYANSIMQYFNTGYKLDFHFPAELLAKMTDYNDVIDYIFTVLPTPSLTEMGQYNLKQSFRKFVGSIKKIEVENNRINLTNYNSVWRYKSYSTDATRSAEFETHSSDYKTLFNSLLLFENGQVNDRIGCDTHSAEYCDFSTKYTIYGKKVTHIKFYKNNKITLYFNSATEAKEFYNFFDCSTLPTSRW